MSSYIFKPWTGYILWFIYNDINYTCCWVIFHSFIIIYEVIFSFLKVLCLLMCLVNEHLNDTVSCFAGCWRTAKSIRSAPENNLLSFVVMIPRAMSQEPQR